MISWTEVLGLVAGACTTAAVTPQIWKAWKTKEVEDVSVGMYLVLITGLALWLIYGIIENDIPIMVTNGTALLLNLFMLYLIFRYRH
ncbi:MtN3 and saliva related transmembrane protein [Salinimicrobium catena]|uniref:MtN3 and saliva related transmembrane protein n=1 Tax=Salinimicrobium catena TaxID=390640 RepID=A0A1H5JUX2_9FLAO|nr:SemiSWEET transporter [Salinimicrobium catena]SDK90647.1 MtN3 and saliva related transmembrane protein [Salinimicrobium catena]SEE56232.1 MtN3 and saliva related transmembrane protein [Salinimicrobium catena]